MVKIPFKSTLILFFSLNAVCEVNLFTDFTRDELKSAFELQEIPQALLELRKLLSENTAQRSNCGEYESSKSEENFNKLLSSNQCSVEKMCNVLNENIFKKYIYENSEGERIKNPIYDRFISPIAGCYDNGLRQIYEKTAYQNKTVKNVREKIQKMEEEQIAARKEFEKYREQIGISNSDMSNIKKSLFHLAFEEDFFEDERVEIVGKVLKDRAPKDKLFYGKWKEMFDKKNALRKAQLTFYQIESENFILGFAAGGITVDQEKIAFSHHVFKETQKYFMRYLDSLKNRVTPKVLLQLKKRIETISFSPATTINSIAYSKCLGSEGAFYSQRDHKFFVCPSLAENTQAGLLSIFAHEMAHSIDPCQLAGDFMRVSKESKFKDDAIIVHDEVPSFSVNLSQVDKNQYDSFETIKMDLLFKGIPYHENPFKREMECLRNKDSFGTREASKDEIIRHFKRRKDVDSQQKDEDIETVENTYGDFKGCPFYEGSSEMGENFSDLLSSKVVEIYLKDQPRKQQRRKSFESFVFFLKNRCDYSKSPKIKEVERHLKKIKCSPGLKALNHLKKNYSKFLEVVKSKEEDGPHSPLKERIIKGYLASPVIQRAMGCKVKAKYCGAVND
ncbi:MAG: hypothetical protein CME64_00065 [Halobacteriovoraceae bacterium]|nr:hypothetical protein [Halobacteriovoraceae bacterium]|tara:strand:- start:11932 stop:13785 length:1854 start_codon:yes stop_codon:yes gene_type:complete